MSDCPPAASSFLRNRQIAESELLLGFGCSWRRRFPDLYLTRDALLRRFDAKLRIEALTLVTLTEQKWKEWTSSSPTATSGKFDDRVATGILPGLYPSGKTIERSDSLKRQDLPRRFWTWQSRILGFHAA